jgi:hypothetical protein
MPICPAGHQTSQTDFCDTCGLPVPGGQPGIPAAPPPVVVTAATVICPNCQVPNVAEALFCEACGYDFTTGTLPAPDDAPAAVTDQPAQTVAVAEPPAPDAATDDPAPPSADPEVDGPEPVAEAPAEDAPAAAPAADAPAAPAPRPTVEWVAELWIDPDWYAAQGSTDPLPSPGLPDIAPLVKESNLVGRVSHSRGIFPDVDCELDTGCSRRHAMLTTDGTRWWIEDLNSANGTFVGSAAGPLPAMPIPQGRVELTPGQRIYVGAWTRIVVRRATEDEQEALS